MSPGLFLVRIIQRLRRPLFCGPLDNADGSFPDGDDNLRTHLQGQLFCHLPDHY
jgi:hypothetical protein